MAFKVHERHHYSTYYFANVVANVLDDTMPYIRNLEAFCGDTHTQYFLQPFPRWSALHRFIEFIVEDLFFEEDLKSDPDPSIGKLWMELALTHHAIPFQSYSSWCKTTGADPAAALHDWYCDLAATESYEKLSRAIARDVFATLFANRRVLLKLNELIAGHVVDAFIDDESILPFLTDKNLAKRVAIPKWASRAVFYRDHGRCTGCQRDLTGLLSPQFDSHIDHILPLARGGINDVTNLQLLCADCNLGKASRRVPTSNLYEPCYDDGQ